MASIYCSNCGQLIPAASNFCKFCGAAQHGEEASVFRAQKPAIADPVGAQAVAQTQKVLSSDDVSKDQQIPRRHLCSRAKWSFVLGYLTYTGIILLLFLIGLIFDPVIFGGAIVFYIFSLYIFASLVHSYFYYEVDEHGFNMEYGILNKRKVSIPFDKIHNVNITRSVSDRILGLARVEIETSGNESPQKSEIVGNNSTFAEGMLPGITLKQAQIVHDLLLEKSQEK